MESIVDWQIESTNFIVEEEKTQESGGDRRVKEVGKELALVLERGFTANQVDYVPLPNEEIARRHCYNDRRNRVMENELILGRVGQLHI